MILKKLSDKMKKLTHSELLRIDHYRQMRWRRKILRLNRVKNVALYVLAAPNIMNFSSNYNQTVRFFEHFKNIVLKNPPIRYKGRTIPRRFRVDLSTIENISVPAALVLAAEFHRWRLLHRASLQPHNVRRWRRDVRAMLDDLGMFKLLDFEHVRPPNAAPPSNLVVLQLVSAEDSDAEMVHQLQILLAGVVTGFTQKNYLHEGLFEAASNSISHAYLEVSGPPPIYPFAGRRWWATSWYDPLTNSLRFIVYDQGVGIPRTLPAKDWYERFRSWAADKLPKIAPEDDAGLIEGAFQYGRSGTGDEHRGKGLRQMADVIDQAGGGLLRIFSGRGEVRYTAATKQFETRNRKRHIGGTLAEWTLPCGAFGVGLEK